MTEGSRWLISILYYFILNSRLNNTLNHKVKNMPTNLHRKQRLSDRFRTNLEYLYTELQ